MLQTKDARIEAGDNGTFDIVLSNDTLDRDGDSLAPGAWVQPLPKSIPIKANHSRSVSNIVGSGEPFIDGYGNLRVRGTYASTPLAQEIRTLVNEGHLQSVSVEFLTRKDADGNESHELTGGAFVDIPANPTARVLSSKAADGWTLESFTAALDALLKDVAPVQVTTKSDDDAEAKALALALRMKS